MDTRNRPEYPAHLRDDRPGVSLAEVREALEENRRREAARPERSKATGVQR